MKNKDLTAIIEKVHSQYFSHNSKKIEAQFYPYRSLRHTIKWNHKFISLRISQYLSNAPINIMENLAIILLAKVYKIKPDKSIKDSYRNYTESISNILPERRRRIPKDYFSQGKYYNLKNIFDILNLKYFSNKLSVKYLGWSKYKSYTRLGYYDKEKELLVISNIFDSKKVPDCVIEYLVYHEMLHILIPTTTENGRRKIHPPNFRQLERNFPEYSKIQNWIKKKRFVL
jgi:predicted metal-dependent hydrolase